MLARYYSSSLGRFVAVDPGNDTYVEDPQSWNKYAYTRNNPIKFIDPNGAEIRYAEGTDPAFIQATEQAMANAVLQDPTGRIGLAYTVAMTSTNVHMIYPGDWEHGNSSPPNSPDASNGVGTDSTHYFNENGYTDSDGQTHTGTELAAHMLAHMEDFDQGTLDPNASCEGCAPNKETQAVRMENLIRPNNPVTMHRNRPVPNPRGAPSNLGVRPAGPTSVDRKIAEYKTRAAQGPPKKK